MKHAWRRGRDSNPRYTCAYSAFRVRCDRPLCHLSGADGEALRTLAVGVARRLAWAVIAGKTVCRFATTQRGGERGSSGGLDPLPSDMRHERHRFADLSGEFRV